MRTCLEFKMERLRVLLAFQFRMHRQSLYVYVDDDCKTCVKTIISQTQMGGILNSISPGLKRMSPPSNAFCFGAIFAFILYCLAIMVLFLM